MFALLKPQESALVLLLLLGRHPELITEADELAKTVLTKVDTEDVAKDVEQAILGLDFNDLEARVGRKSWDYVEPTDAAYELLDEQLAPFIGEMERHIQLGFEAAATAMCAGIVLGLYRCRGKNSERVLCWAEDFPEKKPVWCWRLWCASDQGGIAVRGGCPIRSWI